MSQTTTTNISPLAVGRYLDAQGVRQPLPYSLDEVARAKSAYRRIFSTFHFRTGHNVLVTALFDQSAQLLGAERAIMDYSLVVVSADSSLYDAGRVESIVRRFPLAGVLGLSADTLEGLRGLGHDPLQLFRDKIIWARPGAYEQLAGQPGLTVYRWIELGPAFGIECQAGDGVHIDRFEWAVEEDNGEIVLSSQLDRCVTFSHYHTGVKGKVVRGACRCGNFDPRIQLHAE